MIVIGEAPQFRYRNRSLQPCPGPALTGAMFPSALTNSRVARTISRHVFGNQRPRIVRSATIRVLVSPTSWNDCPPHELPLRDKRLEAEMRALIGCAAILFALATVTSAEAKGCLKGAAVGGVAGHFAGHHGVLGAAAGCVVGRHEANKRDRMQTNQTDQTNRELRKGEERL
jgi:hypothetical protein